MIKNWGIRLYHWLLAPALSWFSDAFAAVLEWFFWKTRIGKFVGRWAEPLGVPITLTLTFVFVGVLGVTEHMYPRQVDCPCDCAALEIPADAPAPELAAPK